MIGSTIRQYKIKSELGKGGMGVVYKAEHTHLPKLFAIKRLSLEFSKLPAFRERFLEEANNQARLDHPGIVRATDLFEENGYFYFVMDYVEGEDLDNRIRESGKLQEAEALKILRDLLEALQFAHNKNVVHRDIKPANILITEGKRTLITDFGIAILLGGKRFTNVSSGHASGTAWYMSPEQIKAPEDVDHRSDIYSVGIVLYEMLTGEVPFGNDEKSEFNVQEQQIKASLPNPQQKNPSISNSVVKMIRKAMDKNPANRYQSCSEFLQDLAAKTAPPPSESFTSSKSLVIAASLIAIAIGGAVFYFDSKPSPIVVTQQDPQQERDTAFILIQGATEQATLVCSKLEELPLKQSNLDIAQENGFFDLIDGYRAQIEDIKKTISDGNAKFNEFVIQLKEIDSSIVDKEFDSFAAYLDQQGRLDQAPLARLTKNYFKNQSNSRSEIIQGMCEENRKN